MKTTLSLFLLLLVTVSYGQDFRCFQPGVKRYFNNNTGYLRGMRIDSVRISGSDTIYYPFRCYRNLENDTSGGSWLGKIATEKPGGIFQCTNMWHDTVFINTRAVTGDTWIFYNDSTIKYYRATVTSVDTQTVSGVLDSVKTITINAFNGSTADPTDSINNYEIKLSKNFGFVQVFDFYTFPYRGLGYTSTTNDYYRYYATGLSYRAANEIFRIQDYKMPKLLDIYDFRAGDMFERKVSSSSLFSYFGWEHISFSGLRLDSIMSVDSVDAFHKNYRVFHHNTESDYNTSSHTTTSYDITFIDTLVADTTPLYRLVKMPEEYKADDHYLHDKHDCLYYYNPGSASFCSRGDEYEIINPHGNWPQFIYASNYKKGFIQTYKEVDYWGGTGWENYIVDRIYTELIYSRKNGVGCGSFLNLGVKNADASTPVYKIYPNPANALLHIHSTSSEPYTVTVTDVLGQVRLVWGAQKNDTEIDISSLPAGLYCISIINGKGQRFTDKLTILH